MRAKLRAKAAAVGIDDDAVYLRMLIYRDVNGLEAAPLPREPEAIGAVATFRQPHAAPPASDHRERDEPEIPADEPRAEDMEMPADADEGAPADLDELLAGAGSLLDEMLAQGGNAPPAVLDLARGPAPRGYRTQLSNRDRGLVALAGPGSRTRPLGVNDQVVGANNYGDGHRNVLRDNFGHFGFYGMRSR